MTDLSKVVFRPEIEDEILRRYFRRKAEKQRAKQPRRSHCGRPIEPKMVDFDVSGVIVAGAHAGA